MFIHTSLSTPSLHTPLCCADVVKSIIFPFCPTAILFCLFQPSGRVQNKVCFSSVPLPYVSGTTSCTLLFHYVPIPFLCRPVHLRTPQNTSNGPNLPLPHNSFHFPIQIITFYIHPVATPHYCPHLSSVNLYPSFINSLIRCRHCSELTCSAFLPLLSCNLGNISANHHAFRFLSLSRAANPSHQQRSHTTCNITH